jgi:hypothetical protein
MRKRARKIRAIHVCLMGMLLIMTAACTVDETQPQYTLTPLMVSEGEDSSQFSAELSVPPTVLRCAPLEVTFTITNHTDQAVYLLNWYTPLEGVFGDIFQVTYEGQILSYLGPQVMRVEPLADQYIFLSAGESKTAVVDLSTSYDFSRLGRYTIKFKSPQISDVVADDSDFAASVEDLGPVQIDSDAVEVEVVASEDGQDVCAGDAYPPMSGPQGNPGEGAANTIILTGIVQDVSLSARVIWLVDAVDGFDILALMSDCTIASAGGTELGLEEIMPGLVITVSGQPGEDQVLLVDAIQVVPPPEK